MNPGTRMLLLLIDADSARAGDVEGHLRHLGMAVHATRCDHVNALPPDAPAFDLCVIALDGAASLAGADLTGLRERGQHCPVLALGQPEFDSTLGAILAHGFADWVGIEDPLHLREAARRELASASALTQTQQLRAALLDSERRTERIMHSTRDAHAVVIDGVHANANNPYLRLLKLDPDRATATPYLDCIIAEEQPQTRELLRQFGRGEREEHAQMQTFALANGETRTLETHYSQWLGDGERGVLISPRLPARSRKDALTTGPSSTAVEQAEQAPDAPSTGDPASAETDAETQQDPAPDLQNAPPSSQEQSVGGLAAELDQNPADVAPPTSDEIQPEQPLASDTAPAKPVASAGALRERLRQSIRQNKLIVRTHPMQVVGEQDMPDQLLVTLAPGSLLHPLTDGDAVRRVAVRVGLAAALDRWLLFVASRQCARRTDQRMSNGSIQLHVALCETALEDPTLVEWLRQLAGQYSQLKHTIWLPLVAARKAPEQAKHFCGALDAIGMRLCLTDAFQSAGDLTDLRDISPHDVCLHSGVLQAWSSGRFSAENLQRLTSLLRGQGIGTLCAQGAPGLDMAAAERLGFCLIRHEEREFENAD